MFVNIFNAIASPQSTKGHPYNMKFNVIQFEKFHSGVNDANYFHCTYTLHHHNQHRQVGNTFYRRKS